MALAPIQRRRRTEPMIALINIVFLMLVFFLVAATLAPPLDPRVRLVNAERLEGRAPPDAAVILRDGTLLFRGEQIAPTDYLALRRSEEDDGASLNLRLVPDRDLPAVQLMSIAAQLRRAGADEVWLVTERGLR